MVTEMVSFRTHDTRKYTKFILCWVSSYLSAQSSSEEMGSAPALDIVAFVQEVLHIPLQIVMFINCYKNSGLRSISIEFLWKSDWMNRHIFFYSAASLSTLQLVMFLQKLLKPRQYNEHKPNNFPIIPSQCTQTKATTISWPSGTIRIPVELV